MPRPLIATIDLSALQHNLAIAQRNAPHAKIWAVVKANAYGHGLERGLRSFGAAHGLALIEFDGAVMLRELGWHKPILMLEGCFTTDDLRIVAEHQLEIVIHCTEQIDMLEKAGLTSSIDVHLKMNSGMNRLGFKQDAYRAAYSRLRTLSAIRNIRLMTHFANAENGCNLALPLAEQVRRFGEATSGLVGERSLSNSAADLLHPDVAADWVRPGVMLYGATPGCKTAQEFGLLPAMTLTSNIIGTQDLDVGDAVGYGSRFIADKPMRIGVVACGYADGYPRHAPSGTPIIIDGVRTRIVGNVSMDMITADLSMIPNARIGSRVTLWGDGLPIDEVAQAAGTIGYELMCALTARVQVVERVLCS